MDASPSSDGVERIVVAVRDSTAAPALLRRGLALAGPDAFAHMLVVHVIRSDDRSGGQSGDLVEMRQLVSAAGTSLHVLVGDDVADTLGQFAGDVGATQLVLGVDLQRGTRGTARSVMRAGARVDLHLVPVAGLGRAPAYHRGAARSRHADGGWVGRQRSSCLRLRR